MRRIGWGTVCALIGGVSIVVAALLVFTPVKADAQPYGGCKEANQTRTTLHSPGARDCRRHGWIVRAHLTVTPDGRAFTDLPKCEQEDVSTVPCYWNAKRRGNHAGHGFIALAGRTVYVDRINGRQATTGMLEHRWTIVPV